MLKRGDRTGFLAKARLKAGIVRQIGVHDLQRHRAIKVNMSRTKHLPHAPGAEHCFNPIITDRLTDELCHRGRSENRICGIMIVTMPF